VLALTTAAIVIGVSACSQAADSVKPVAQSQTPATQTVTAAPTTQTVTAVPTSASPDPETVAPTPGDTRPLLTCEALFTTSKHLNHLVDFYVKRSVSLAEIDTAHADNQAVADIGSKASEPLHGYLALFVSEMGAYLTNIQSTNSSDFTDSTKFKRATLGVTHTCESLYNALPPSHNPPVTSAPPPPPPATHSAKPKPPRRVVVAGNGVFQVGRDIPPGTYRSPGSQGPGYLCVVYASRHPSDLTTYLRGSTVEGPTIISVSSGEYLNTQFCADFHKD
jgi:hypothetical protein